jgi:uncharacterized RDD family membrane protein YckC
MIAPPPAAMPPPQPMQVYQYSGGQEPAYAGFWIRFVAAFIDNAIINIALFVLGFIVGFLLAFTRGGTLPSSANLLFDVIWFLIWASYFIFFWGVGSTIGMQRFGLRVADPNTGNPIGFERAAIRLGGYVISAVACYIGLIWAAFDPRKQGWHDKMANSIVVRN